MAGEAVLEAASSLSWSLALGDPAVDVVAGDRVGREMSRGEVVQGPVEVAIAASVETMSGALATARFGRAGPGEGGFGANSAGVGPADPDLSGGHGADAGLGQKDRNILLDRLPEILLDHANVGGQCSRATSQALQRLDPDMCLEVVAAAMAQAVAGVEEFRDGMAS